MTNHINYQSLIPSTDVIQLTLTLNWQLNKVSTECRWRWYVGDPLANNDWLLTHYWPSINRWVMGPTIGHMQCIDQHLANTLPTLDWDSTDVWPMYWLIMSTDTLVNTTYKTEIPLLLALLLTCLLFQVLDDFMYYGSCNLQAEVECTGFTL